MIGQGKRDAQKQDAGSLNTLEAGISAALMKGFPQRPQSRSEKNIKPRNNFYPQMAADYAEKS